jgi:aldose 1-epimerase
MSFAIRTERRPVAGLDGTIYILEGAGARAEVWPAFGGNCFAWQVRRGEEPIDLLYADPQLFVNSSPSRSGIPVLFPFPNRIRDGRFTWDGKSYELPCNDSTHKNAIHGFACRHPWRVIGQSANANEATLTTEFQGSKDAPESRKHWPADYVLRLTFRLAAERLRLEAIVENPDRVPLPFGLGYHPYFRVPLGRSGQPENCWVQAPPRQLWQLDASLPTGTRCPVDAARDLRTPRRFPELTLDDVFTDLPSGGSSHDELVPFGSVRQSDLSLGLSVLTSPDFRELVAFTPPHRHAVCLEPYTCTTDAINLQLRGVDAGWRVLAPGERWSGVVELRVEGLRK